MNLVLEEAVEVISLTEKNDIGTIVIRGNSLENFELLEREAMIDRCTGNVGESLLQRPNPFFDAPPLAVG